MNDTTRPRLWRSRWAAIGAAVAVSVGAGGLYSTYATSPASNLVAISPVRVLDTRLTAMGPALTSATARLLDVTGAIPTVGTDGRTITTATVVPDGATAIVANVTIVEPTTPGFLSVRPGSASGAPTTSSLNASTAGVVVPNSVTVELPTTGATAGNVQLWFQGTAADANANVLVDIVGYYQAATQAPTGGMRLLTTLSTDATTGMGSDFPPQAPTAYTVSAELKSARYFVSGDLTVRNGDLANAGQITCALYAGESRVSVPAIQGIDGGTTNSNYVVFPINVSFVQPTAGPTTVSYRCYRNNIASAFYDYMNLTVFEVDGP